MRKFWRTYGPGRTPKSPRLRLALVNYADARESKVRLVQRFNAFQIFGTKKFSLSVVWLGPVESVKED